jgi:uncharacterized protein
MQKKLEKLKAYIASMESAAVAFSGGVDSTFLATAAHQVLGRNMVAVTVVSSIIPRLEKKMAVEYAGKAGIPHTVLELDALTIPELRDNVVDRCYYCKKVIFSRIKETAAEKGLKNVFDGTNVDDRGDYRPGIRALEELGIISPLKECGFKKEDVRELSREMKLPTWDLPSMACLASRFPYGTVITEQKLKTVDRAEDFLREHGLEVVRVRHLGDTARIETNADSIPRFLNESFRRTVIKKLRSLGFIYIDLDLEGYRTGSMNLSVKKD